MKNLSWRKPHPFTGIQDAQQLIIRDKPQQSVANLRRHRFHMSHAAMLSRAEAYGELRVDTRHARADLSCILPQAIYVFGSKEIFIASCVLAKDLAENICVR